MWVWEDRIVDLGTDIDSLRDKVLELKKTEKALVWKDDPEPEKPKLTNCKNCGAPLTGTKCEYCGTEYAPKIEKPYCEEAKDLIKVEDVKKSVLDSLVVTNQNLQNSFFDLSDTADDAKRAFTVFEKEIGMMEAEEKVLGFFVWFLVAVALIGIIVIVLNLFV